MARGRFGRAVTSVPTGLVAIAFGALGALTVAGTALASTTTGPGGGNGTLVLVAAGVGVVIGAAWLLKPSGWRLRRRERRARGSLERVR